MWKKGKPMINLRKLIRESLGLDDNDVFFLEASSKLQENLSSEVQGKPIRIGLATYDTKGYKIIHDDNNDKIKDILNTVNPTSKLSRGQSFSPIAKTTPYGIGVTVPVAGQGAGGAVPFISLALYATQDKEDVKKAAKQLIGSNVISGENKMGLQRIINAIGE